MKCRLKMPKAEKIDVPLNVPSKRQNYQKKNYIFSYFSTYYVVGITAIHLGKLLGEKNIYIFPEINES